MVLELTRCEDKKEVSLSEKVVIGQREYWGLNYFKIEDVKEVVENVITIMQELSEDDRHTDDYRRGMKSAINFIKNKFGSFE